MGFTKPIRSSTDVDRIRHWHVCDRGGAARARRHRVDDDGGGTKRRGGTEGKDGEEEWRRDQGGRTHGGRSCTPRKPGPAGRTDRRKRCEARRAESCAGHHTVRARSNEERRARARTEAEETKVEIERTTNRQVVGTTNTNHDDARVEDGAERKHARADRSIKRAGKKFVLPQAR